MAALRGGGSTLDVIRFADPAMEGSSVVLDTHDKIDQPWVQAISVVGGPDNGKDRIYIGYNDSRGSGAHPVATIDFCLDALADQPIFTQVQLETRKVLFNNATVRPVVHRDGTVFVAYVSSLSESGHTTTSDILVARDNNWGRNNFADLRDPIDGATVEAIVDPSSASQTTETDGTGNYTLSNVLSGRRQVIATARGYSGDSQIVKVTAGLPPVRADFTLVRKRSRRG